MLPGQHRKTLLGHGSNKLNYMNTQKYIRDINVKEKSTIN